MANCPYKCINMTTGEQAIANAKLIYDRNRYKFRLVCIKTIYPKDEIMYYYSKNYVYPVEYV